jgi:hypothetical protein
MPRRGRSSPMRSPSPPARSYSRSNVPAPAPAPPSQPMPYQQAAPQGPGLMKQMAATAGGVAIGSTVGHVVGHALVGGMGGGGGGGGQQEVAQQQPAAAQQQQQNQNQDPCAQEIQAFLRCAQGQHDITLCEGFNEAIRQCRQYGANQV